MKFNIEHIASIESDILKQVRAHPGISRVVLARNLQIAPSTAGNYVGRLIEEGFLTESETVECESGRPPTALRLSPDGGQFIGVDFEARNIMAMAVDFSDRPLRQAHKEILPSDSVLEIIAKIEQAITEVLPAQPGRLLAIGVGVPGLVDPIRGVAIKYKYINGWENIPLAGPLAKRFGVPVYLENTIRSMALAEQWFGQGRGLTDWLCIGIRSGLGVGMVANGRLLHGGNHRAGEIGRWLCPESSQPVARFFRSAGTAPTVKLELQEMVSPRAILAALERARQAGEKTSLTSRDATPTFAEVLQAVQLQDRLTVQIIETAAEMLGWAISQLTLALNPAQVILAGPLTLLGETLLLPTRRQAGDILKLSDADVPIIVNSTMGEYNGALGAAALAVDAWKPTR
jgi:predicted NBD/HSP70 family sugar kinase